MSYTTVKDIINFTPEEFWKWIARTSPDRQDTVKVDDVYLCVQRMKAKKNAATRTADTGRRSVWHCAFD